MATGCLFSLRCVMGELGNELELEKLSSNRDSERQVEMDLAEPELMEPVPEIVFDDLDYLFAVIIASLHSATVESLGGYKITVVISCCSRLYLVHNSVISRS